MSFLIAPLVAPPEVSAELAIVPPAARPELLIARAATAKEWLRILDALQSMKIVLRQAERGASDPLVAVWAGEASENPEPIAVAADLILLGGGWELLRRAVVELEQARGLAREEKLERLAALAGVYVPSLYDVEYSPDGPIARVTPRSGVPPPVGLGGATPFPAREETGYRRCFVGSPRGEVESIVERIKRERHAERARHKREPSGLAVSLTCLVPWPWGPYQWAPMATEKRLKDEIHRASRMLAKVRGVRVTHDQPKWALLEGVLRMGDRRAGDLLLLTHRVGWDRAQVASPLNPAFVIHRARPKEEVLPWDHVGWGLDRERLWQEFSQIVGGAEKR